MLCAGALRTPIVLLRSNLRNNLVGRNLRLHPTVVVAAKMPTRVAMWRDTMQAARSLEFREQGIVIESAARAPGADCPRVPLAERRPAGRDDA